MSKNLQIQTSFDLMKQNNQNFQTNLTDYLSISKVYTNSNNSNTNENIITELPSTRNKILKKILVTNKLLRPQTVKNSRNFKELYELKYNSNFNSNKVQLANNYIILPNSRKKYLIYNDKELYNIFDSNTLSNFNNKYDIIFQSKKKNKRKLVRKVFDDIKQNGFNGKKIYFPKNKKKINLIKKEPIIENISKKDQIKNSFFITDYHNYFKYSEKNNYIKNFKSNENIVINNDYIKKTFNNLIDKKSYLNNKVRVYSLKITNPFNTIIPLS